MGLFNDLKKLFFANKAIAKSAANKVKDAAAEQGEILKDKAEELAAEAKENADEWTETLKNKANEAAEDLKENVENWTNTVKKKSTDLTEDAKEYAQDIKDKVDEKMNVSFENEVPKSTAADSDLLDDIMKERTRREQTSTPIEEPKESIFGDDNPIKGSAFSKTSDQLKKAGSDILKTAKDAANDLGEAIGNNPTIKKAADVSEQVGDKILDAGEDFMEKIGDTSEKVGGKVLETGDKVLDKLGKASEDIGSKILNKKEELIKKAEAAAKAEGKSFDSLADTAKKMGQELEDKITGKVDVDEDFAKTPPPHLGESELNKHGSFWDKAEKYADGNYSMEEEKKQKPGELTIGDNPDFEPKKKEGRTKGFDDMDGDGNDLIDDAIIDEG